MQYIKGLLKVHNTLRNATNKFDSVVLQLDENNACQLF